jgi:hypothetical protein
MKTSSLILSLVLLILMGCSKDDSPNSSGESNPPGSNTQTIDNVNAANGDISIALDRNDKLHVCYESFNTGLKYATNKTGTWVTSMIFTENARTANGGGSDIAVDSSGFVHIVYATFSMSVGDTASIIYATNKSGSWVNTTIALTTVGQFSGVGIATTPSGKTHVVYGDQTMHLSYKNNLSGSWTTAGILGTYWAGVRPRLALDASNNVYVAYEHGGEGTLHLQVINSVGNPVSNSIIDGVSGSGTSVGWSPHVAINRTTGAVLIPYWNYDTHLLRLYNGGTITTLDTLTNWTAPAIVTDNSGKTYICYTDLSTNQLCYVSNKTGPWVCEILPVSAISMKSDLAVESTGKVDFVYCQQGAVALNIVSK